MASKDNSDPFYRTLVASHRIDPPDLERLWAQAAQFDTSLKMRRVQPELLRSKRIVAMPYSRSALFDRMADSAPSLFWKFPVSRRWGKRRLSRRYSMANEVVAGFPTSKRARVRTLGGVRMLSIPRVMELWNDRSRMFNVTDLHYAGSRFDRRVDTHALNDFNLLPRGNYGFQSQDSLVLSTAGAVTDSHSDDHSGSNHSFVGTKLWLLWDTLEGFQHGLEDVEHSSVFDRAAFDMSAFLAMKSSCWILIGPGQTMFIPANFTHKVISLESYIGLGSFYAGLPGFIDSLLRWQHLPPQWMSTSRQEADAEVAFLTRRAIRRVRSLGDAPRQEQMHWGMPQLRRRLARLDSNRENTSDETWAAQGNLARFVAAVRSATRTLTAISRAISVK